MMSSNSISSKVLHVILFFKSIKYILLSTVTIDYVPYGVQIGDLKMLDNGAVSVSYATSSDMSEDYLSTSPNSLTLGPITPFQPSWPVGDGFRQIVCINERLECLISEKQTYTSTTYISYDASSKTYQNITFDQFSISYSDPRVFKRLANGLIAQINANHFYIFDYSGTATSTLTLSLTGKTIKDLELIDGFLIFINRASQEDLWFGETDGSEIKITSFGAIGNNFLSLTGIPSTSRFFATREKKIEVYELDPSFSSNKNLILVKDLNLADIPGIGSNGVIMEGDFKFEISYFIIAYKCNGIFGDINPGLKIRAVQVSDNGATLNLGRRYDLTNYFRYLDYNPNLNTIAVLEDETFWWAYFILDWFECSTNCTSCNYPQNGVRCTACKTGWDFVQSYAATNEEGACKDLSVMSCPIDVLNENLDCTTCGDQMQECSACQSPPFYCSSCSTGFFLNSSSLCQKECNTGEILTSSNTCAVITDIVPDCISMNNYTTTCLDCSTGFFLNSSSLCQRECNIDQIVTINNNCAKINEVVPNCISMRNFTNTCLDCTAPYNLVINSEISTRPICQEDLKLKKTLYNSEENTAILEFSHKISPINLENLKKNYNYKLFENEKEIQIEIKNLSLSSDNTQILLQIYIEENVNNGVLKIEKSDQNLIKTSTVPNIFIKEFNYTINDIKYEIAPKEEKDKEKKGLPIPEEVMEAIEGTVGNSKTVVAATAFININVAFTLLKLFKFFEYLPLINLPIPSNLEKTLDVLNWGDFSDHLPNLLEVDENDLECNNINDHLKNEEVSCSILNNSGMEILQICFIFFIKFLFLGLKFIFDSKRNDDNVNENNSKENDKKGNNSKENNEKENNFKENEVILFLILGKK